MRLLLGKEGTSRHLDSKHEKGISHLYSEHDKTAATWMVSAIKRTA